MDWQRTCSCALVSFGLTLAPEAHGAVVVNGDPADAVVRSDGSRILGTASGRVGAAVAAFTPQSGGRAAVYVFHLPRLGSADLPRVVSANLRFAIVSDLPDGPFGIDLYGLDARPDPAVLSTDYYAGPLDTTDATLLQSDIIPSDHPDFGVEWLSEGPAGDRALVDYLNDQYDQGRQGQFAFLRLNPDAVPPIGDTGVNVGFAESVTHTPQLTIVFAPEPGSALLWPVLLAGICLRSTRRVSRRVSNLNANRTVQTDGIKEGDG